MTRTGALAGCWRSLRRSVARPTTTSRRAQAFYKNKQNAIAMRACRLPLLPFPGAAMRCRAHRAGSLFYAQRFILPRRCACACACSLLPYHLFVGCCVAVLLTRFPLFCHRTPLPLLPFCLLWQQFIHCLWSVRFGSWRTSTTSLPVRARRAIAYARWFLPAAAASSADGSYPVLPDSVHQRFGSAYRVLVCQFACYHYLYLPFTLLLLNALLQFGSLRFTRQPRAAAHFLRAAVLQRHR